VEDEGARKPKDMDSFQVLAGSGDGTWYTKNGKNYSVTSSNTIKEKIIKDEVLSKRIKELERLLDKKEGKLSCVACIFFLQLLTLFRFPFQIQENNDQTKKYMIQNTEILVLLNRAELETVKHIVGTLNKRNKVRKIIAPEEGSGDSKRVSRKPKKVTIKMSKKKK